MADQSAKQKRNRTTSAQKEYLIDYMNTHPEFAAGRYCGQMGQKTSERQWERLTQTLNGLGNVKTPAQWQKVWADLKSRARNKTKDAAKNMRQTGNPSMDSSLIITPTDAKVLSTIGAQSCLGHENIPDSMASPQVVFEGGRLIVLEPEQDEDEEVDGPLEEASNTDLVKVMDAQISVAPEESTVAPEESTVAPEEWLQSSLWLTSAATSSSTTETGAGQSTASAVGPSTSTAAFLKTKSSARQHFSRTRERRVELAAEVKEQFASIQQSQAKSQEMMAKALLKLAETDAARLQLDAARLEQDRVNATAILAMAEAIKGLTRALEGRRSHDE